MENNSVYNPTRELITSANNMCTYIDSQHKCSGPCSECPLVKVIMFVEEMKRR